MRAIEWGPHRLPSRRCCTVAAQRAYEPAGHAPARPANRWSRAAAPPTGGDSRVLQALGPGRRRAAASPSGSGSRDGSGRGQSASTVCPPGLGGCRAAGVGARCEPRLSAIVRGPHRLASRWRGAGVARRARAPAVRTPARVAGPAPRYPPLGRRPPTRGRLVDRENSSAAMGPRRRRRTRARRSANSRWPSCSRPPLDRRNRHG